VSPKVARAGKDTLSFQFFGMKTTAIDMLYTLDGQTMHPIRNWRLDSNGRAETFVSPGSQKGIYHMIGVRDAGGNNPWFKVDATAEIK
jgi:hypothetical protein